MDTTLISSIIAAVVSLVGAGFTIYFSNKASNTSSQTAREVANISKETAKRSAYLGTISASRDKWQDNMRKSASGYFSTLALLCGNIDNDTERLYADFLKYHFELVTLIFEENKIEDKYLSDIKVLVDNMMDQQRIKTESLDNGAMTQANAQILSIKHDIIQHHYYDLLHYIRKLIEAEWWKQKYEAMEMWNITDTSKDKQ